MLWHVHAHDFFQFYLPNVKDIIHWLVAGVHFGPCFHPYTAVCCDIFSLMLIPCDAPPPPPPLRSPSCWGSLTSAPACCRGTLCSSGTAGRRWPSSCVRGPPSCPAQPRSTRPSWSSRWGNTQTLTWEEGEGCGCWHLKMLFSLLKILISDVNII